MSAGATGAQKAFDPARYRGTAAGRSLELVLANGYPNGSTLRVRAHTGAARPFLPGPGYDGARQELRFVPAGNGNAAQADEEVLLQGIAEQYAVPPRRIRGYLLLRRHRYAVTLHRQP